MGKTSTPLLSEESSLQPWALPTSERRSPLSAAFFLRQERETECREGASVQREKVVGPPLSPSHACLIWCSLRSECRGRHNGHVLFPSVERLGPLNHKWHPASPGTIWESQPAQEEQNVPSIHPSIRPLLPPALKTSQHRKQLPSLFFKLLMKSSQSLSQLLVKRGDRERFSDREEKR